MLNNELTDQDIAQLIESARLERVGDPNRSIIIRLTVADWAAFVLWQQERDQDE